MTIMDILEFRDMHGPAPMPKSGEMRSNLVQWAIFPPPPPPFLGLRRAWDLISLPWTLSWEKNGKKRILQNLVWWQMVSSPGTGVIQRLLKIHLSETMPLLWLVNFEPGGVIIRLYKIHTSETITLASQRGGAILLSPFLLFQSKHLLLRIELRWCAPLIWGLSWEDVLQ